MKLLEFNLFKKDKSKEKKEDLEVIDTVLFNDLLFDNTMDDIDSDMNKIIGKYVILTKHKNLGGGESRLKVFDIKLNLNKNIEDENNGNLKYHVKINNIAINPNIEVKILGRRIKTAEDPLGEEDWDE